MRTYAKGVRQSNDPRKHLERVAVLELEESKALLFGTTSDTPARSEAVLGVEECPFDFEQRRGVDVALRLWEEGGDEVDCRSGDSVSGFLLVRGNKE